ncbi:hypothetical protein V6N13_019893 [Hibiscus sabdariffa]|uniref:Uncharacterized protein n=1 Tax=Hibiscus sabdariffa TaxID=183260 RepID=A0ABR2ES99_9ROSI
MQFVNSPEEQPPLGTPKKCGQRDEAPIDHVVTSSRPSHTTMEIFAPVVSNPISYNDMLTGSTHTPPTGSIINLDDDDDIELLDDDIIIGQYEGVPTIDLFDRVQSLAIKSMEPHTCCQNPWMSYFLQHFAKPYL